MFTLTFFNYAILHATRSAWSLASPNLTSEFGFSVGLIADMNSTFLFFYAATGIFLGHTADKYRKSKVILLQYTAIALV
jgi:sugar phosphate permease